MAFAVAAEGRAREAGDAGLFEEQVGEVVGGSPCPAMLREGVEGALRA